MHRSATTYAASLNLARDRALRDQRAADAWRRLHADADVETQELGTAEVHGPRAALAALFGALPLRRTRPST